MKRDSTPSGTIDAYIAGFPPKVQTILKEIRKTIRKAEPEFGETIRYGIPTFQLDGKNVIHFAGHTKHTALYPAPRGNKEFARELAAYGGGKGTVQFPLGEPIPHDLIRRIVEFRVLEHREKHRPRKR
jgi:uncharacterized protein YdhG (YjbR/CyaY superfamily)